MTICKFILVFYKIYVRLMNTILTISQLMRVFIPGHIKIIVKTKWLLWALILVILRMEIMPFGWAGVGKPVPVLWIGIVDASVIVHILW